MGINNLLKFMKPYVQSVHIKKYAGKRVGIDAYSWLHKGAYSCSMELSLDMDGDKKFQYIKYFMHRIEMLRHYKITPVVVFDGCNIPCKADTEDERHRRRNEYRDKAFEKHKEGDINGASELFQRAVIITPLMAHGLIQVLRSENVEFVVAPYEADAQLAYLSGLHAQKGGIAAVISEDSDLLAYGCPAIIFKMDRYGNGEEIVLDKVLNNTVGTVPSFKNFDQELFTGMCVLAGCDFLPSVPGVGPARAYNLVSKYQNLDRVLSTLKFEKGKQMPEDYAKAFKEAIAVFQHARVYDAFSRKLVNLKPLSSKLLQNQDELDFLGPNLSPSVAIAIAEGNLDPCIMEAFDQSPEQRYIYHNKHPTFADSANPFLKKETVTESTKEGSFSVLSRHRITKRQSKGTCNMPNPVEALTLQKLASAFKTDVSKHNPKGSTHFASHTPNNNPFKKRKIDEVQLNHAVAVEDELASEVMEIEKSEISHVTPESQQSLWNHRNKIVHGHQSVQQPHDLITLAIEYIDRFKQAKLHFAVTRPPDFTPQWVPPEENTIKINVDASFRSDSNTAGLGVLARDSAGQILAWRRHRMEHIGCSQTAEAFAMLSGMELAMRFGWRNIIVESDCLTLINALNSNTGCGSLVEALKQFFACFDSISFKHVLRGGNILAHCLAKNVGSNCEGGPVLPP